MEKMSIIKKMFTPQVGVKHNVEYVLRDKDGKLKKMFQPNIITQFGLKLGFISPNHPKNFLFGHWSNKMSLGNLVTNAGKAGVSSRINGAGGAAAFTYIALGTGTTAAAATDTTLQTELSTSGLGRANSTATQVTTSVTNDTAQLVNTFSVTGTAAVTESGVLNAASVGTLLCRQVFSAINVVNGDSLQITWKVQAS